ncbi:tumor necrosis factor receptor superfamily member 1B [Ictalurus furcatus]|uniref:tumor necrosis factor receptor superfamily member 1B n=1 Tax=Ictalurus furcatus TaxID=66913 RepID=UPI00234FEC58|nr:tumor necrosis factor receptor superfamily member 1B [Ictalurus furcatus]
MNVGLRCLILGVVASLAKAKSYSLPYKTNGACRDSSTEYKADNFCCSKCKPGTRKARGCTSTEDTVCVPCPDGMYLENMNYYPNCFSCTRCYEDKGVEYAKQCTRVSDAVCVCKPGWYCVHSDDSPSCTSCEKHRPCTPGKGAISPGTATENVRCGICPEGTYSNETSTQPCLPHTRCDLYCRSVLVRGTATTDTVCGPVLSTVPSRVTTCPLTITPKTSSSPTEPSTMPPFLTSYSTSQSLFPVYSPRPPDRFIALWIGLPVAALLMVLLIATFCICHRKALAKPAVHEGVEARQSLNSVHLSSPTENQGLLADSNSDPSTSSSSDSHSQGTGMSQDCIHVEQPAVSSPVLNLSITATFNCQVNPATGSCSIPISPCVHQPEPEFPLSQEEELCVSCEQEDSKDAIQSVQESGMTKY